MTIGFWQHLPRPFFVQAPMANVTDAAFRRMITAYSKPDGPDVMFTEFVSVDGLLSEGRERLLPDLWYTDAERPIVAQIFGARPEFFARCAVLIRELGFDGIDINMGCPDRAVERQGSGAGLIKTPELARRIIAETKRGAESLPVSVKTRIGYNVDELAAWLPQLLEAEPAAITIHARTRKEMSDVPARWDSVQEAVQIRDRYFSRASGPKPLIIGNGDVSSLAEAEERTRETGCDGVMVGRGMFGKPRFFSRVGDVRSVEDRLRIMLEHTRLFEELYRNGSVWGRQSLKSFDVMKKHYKSYVSGFDGAKELRVELMAAESAADVAAVLQRASVDG